jgi:hypothetical protein
MKENEARANDRREFSRIYEIGDEMQILTSFIIFNRKCLIYPPSAYNGTEPHNDLMIVHNFTGDSSPEMVIPKHIRYVVYVDKPGKDYTDAKVIEV